MSALLSHPLLLKGEPFSPHIVPRDSNTTGDAMHHYTTHTISSPDYRFPDVSSIAVSPPSSPSDSPSTSTSALPSANSSSLSLHPTTYSPDLCHLHLPSLSPEEILDTLDHLAAGSPKKKSHARKQPAGHIPRPRNAFILFRCLFVSQQAVPASVEKDHRNISRIAGKVWKSMSDEERDPWLKAAELEKSRHEAKWPGYRYNPIQSQAQPRRFTPVPARPSRPSPKREDTSDYEPYQVQPEREGRCATVAHLVREGKKGVALEAAIRGTYGTPDPDAQMLPPDYAAVRLHAFPATPTPTDFAPGAYDAPFPPASPPPPTHMRLAMRRSSSCPPLPPCSFPFNTPNPWAAAPPAAYAPSPSPFAFPTPSPFAFPPPSPGSAEPMDELRPLTAPEHYDVSPPRVGRRRGSSLDRSIASSSIAGAFGGGLLPRPSVSGHWNFEGYGTGGHHDARHGLSNSNSSGSGTPALSPSPQSSFEGSFESGLFHSARGSPEIERQSRAHHDAVDQLVAYTTPTPTSKGDHEFILAPFTRRMSARLFGSQGARLGLDLDLDLDVPLALDVTSTSASETSPGSAFPYTPTSPSTPYTNYSYTQALMDTEFHVHPHAHSHSHSDEQRPLHATHTP